MTPRRSLLGSTLAVMIMLSQNACMTAGVLEQLPRNAGSARAFPTPPDSAAQAVRSAIQKDKLFLHSEKQLQNGEIQFLAEKGISLNDYGSLVRVLVLADSARPHESLVRVVTKRRLASNITAEHDYSVSLYHHIGMGVYAFEPGAPRILPNSRVRLHYRDGRTESAVLRVSKIDTVVVSGSPTDADRSVALASLKSLEVEIDPTERRQRTQRGMMAGSILGTLAGFGLGYAMGPQSGCADGQSSCVVVDTRIYTGYLAGIVGGFVGMYIGRNTAIPQSGAFKPVPLPVQ